MKEQLEQIRREALAALDETKAAQDLESLRVKYLGKKGELTAVLKQMGTLSAEERPIIGELANNVREALADAMSRRQHSIEEAALNARLEGETLDVTIPGKQPEVGHKHPMSIALDELKDIFVGMGFQIVEGPEVELADYVFTKLNAPEGHPSREWSDTFYIAEDSSVLLRSQTSSMQIRVMESQKPPIRILAPGRVYRKDEVDATHSPMFHQVEGLVVDKGITMADLKGTLNTMVEQLYGKGTKTRFR
ncbi:MAG: phenylalanine--tRNA ligase subunit alpha, partial [Pseudoflavonifractor sp.]